MTQLELKLANSNKERQLQNYLEHNTHRLWCDRLWWPL